MTEKFTIADLESVLASVADRDADAEVRLTESTLHRPLSDLGFDSLSLFNAAVEIEQRCEVNLPTEVFRGTKTPADILEYLDRQGGSEAV